MHFEFDLNSWYIDLLDTNLDLLVVHGQIQISPVNILFICKTSSRRLQGFLKTGLQDVFKTCLQDMSSRRPQDAFSVTIFRLPRRLQDVFATLLQGVFKKLWKTKYCYAEYVLKTSSRHVLKTCSRRLEDQQMFAGMVDISIITSLWPCQFMTSYLSFHDVVSICYCTQLKMPMSTKKPAYF